MNQLKILFGSDVFSALEAEKIARVPRSLIPGRQYCFQSAPLCDLQSEQHSRGIRCAEIVKSIYGWSVRAGSGLDNFRLLAGSRDGTLDGSHEAAVHYAQTWQACDPANRYVFER
jgi:hypothetical protein